MAFRYDETTTIAPVTLPSGAVRIDARTTRTGVFPYARADGSVRREYRPPSEVFADASLATLRGVAVTDLHPDEPVTPSTWRELAVGHVGDDVRADGAFVAASIVVHDAAEIARIQSGERREISMGYEADVDETPGETPEGELYDAVQRRIRYNHAALGPEGWGRAGPLVRLRLDSSSAILDLKQISGIHCPLTPEIPMSEPAASAPVTRSVRLDGAEVVVPEPVAVEIDSLRERLAAAQKRADAAEKAASPEAIRERVKARVRLLDEAKKRKVRHDEAMGDDEIIGSIVAQAFPALDLAGMAHEELMLLLRAAMSQQGAAAPAPDVSDAAAEVVEDPAPEAAPAADPEKKLDAVKSGRPGVGPGVARAPLSKVEAAKQARLERDLNAWKRENPKTN